MRTSQSLAYQNTARWLSRWLTSTTFCFVSPRAGITPITFWLGPCGSISCSGASRNVNLRHSMVPLIPNAIRQITNPIQPPIAVWINQYAACPTSAIPNASDRNSQIERSPLKGCRRTSSTPSRASSPITYLAASASASVADPRPPLARARAYPSRPLTPMPVIPQCDHPSSFSLIKNFR